MAVIALQRLEGLTISSQIMKHPPDASAGTSCSQANGLHERLIATDTYDTVSKRSVERYYCPEEPQFHRYFVKKPQRRTPLVNRLYWLRKRAVEHVVHNFLETSERDTPKTVVNLGCGSDVLPWKFHHRHPDMCSSARFIDVDLPRLMRTKRSTVLATPKLRQLLGADYQVAEDDTAPLMLVSKKYCQVGCDFADVEMVQTVLRPLVMPDTQVLVVAEMSLMYNDSTSADSLIDWLRTGLSAQFCIVEHCFPAGSAYPVANKLLRDNEMNQTPLSSLRTYPDAGHQLERFRTRGYEYIQTWNLWEVWAGDEFLTALERSSIDKLEKFDDWEDLIILARHFYILHASDARQSGSISTSPGEVSSEGTAYDINIKQLRLPKTLKRRFGGAIQAANPEGRALHIDMMGMGIDGINDTYDVLSLGPGLSTIRLPTRGPPARSCFTLTDLGNAGMLLAGGRPQSLDQPHSDSWVFRPGPRPYWEKTDDMPTGLYRHTAVRLGESSMALVFGGRSFAGVSSECLVYHPISGWTKCHVQTPLKSPVFGASAWCLTGLHFATAGRYQGILCGGLGPSGVPNTTTYHWQLEINGSRPSISFTEIDASSEARQNLSLFGSTVAVTASHVFLCGGVGTHGKSNLLGQSITSIQNDEAPARDPMGDRLSSPKMSKPQLREEGSWPLMVGSTVSIHHNTLVVAGGGVSSLSKERIWSENLYTMDMAVGAGDLARQMVDVQLLESPKIITMSTTFERGVNQGPPPITSIPRIRLTTTEEFRTVLNERRPVIIEGLDFGPCLTQWTPQYLAKQVGPETKVVVHESIADSPRLDFNAKNFKYVTETFGKVIEKMQRGGRTYLRSLSRSGPSEKPANLDDDFPSLAPDFQLPPELYTARDSLFSSILRLSGRANMWLHYDVMANIYTQVRGAKRMVLFPPGDATKLAFAPGASSSSFDVFSAMESEGLAGTQPYEASLGEGDALFLPAAWLHTAMPLTDLSVAVNVFFRDLDGGYSEGRDVYGNRDLAAYEKGRHDVARISQSFRNMPQDMRHFYLSRIADELLQLAEKPN